jgi:CheY-like chemotaxis protein
MGLECLIVTCDPILLGHFQRSFGALGASIYLRQDAASAIELASRRHLDGIMIDCDDVLGGTNALAQMRNAPANKQTPFLAVVNGFTGAEAALDLGANFVLSKPIQQARLYSVLHTAIATMEREHRKYFRYEVDTPVLLQNSLGQTFGASMKNVSEGGLAIKLVRPVKLKGVVIVKFEIPSVETQTFRAKADVVWRDSFMVGLRFVCVEQSSGVSLQSWLSSLEARFRFNTST